MTPDPQFIVAEISKSWVGGLEVQPTGPVCRQFEQVIEVNRQRGYRLLQFQYSQSVLPATVLHLVQGQQIEPPQMNETIIAVFEKI